MEEAVAVNQPAEENSPAETADATTAATETAAGNSNEAAEEDSINGETIVNPTPVEKQSETQIVTNTYPNEQLSETTARKELVFVNDNVHGAQILVDDILASEESNCIVDVVILDDETDGINQVSRILEGYDNLDAIHFISHGSDARINIGSSWLSADTLANKSDEVSRWGESLDENGDILFYGCDIASDAEVETSEFAQNIIATGIANNAPVLDAMQNPVLSPLDEDSGSPSGAVGTLVSALFLKHDGRI